MWQPEPEGSRPEDSGGSALPGPHARSDPPRRGRGRIVAFGLVLALGLAALAGAAVGIAHQLLPRQFTPAQQRSIVAWELQRRWRALPAARVFPESVTYQIPAAVLYATSSLYLQARLIQISPQDTCPAAFSGVATRVLREHGCSAAMRATYVDASGGMVATIAVAVLPGSATAQAVAAALPGSADARPALVRALSIPRTAAAGFRDAQRQLSVTTAAGPYVIMATAGFSDGRNRVSIAADPYLYHELASLASGLTRSASLVLGKPPAVPACPGAPGC
jgi:hypothetical protein